MAGQRQQWSSKWTVIFAAVSSAVGLGNIWRFPFTAYDNGGGAFIIPYLIAVFILGVPLMILEFAYGSKFRGATPLSFARAGKKFEFVGWIPTVCAALIIFYYGIILVWALNFAVYSFTMPWTAYTSPSVFFNETYLGRTGSALDFGSIRWPILIGLFVLWIPTYFVLSKDLKKGLERVNSVVLPLMLLFAILLIIRGATLEGAALGLNTFFTPDFNAITDGTVWLAAFGQAMFSLSLAMGIMVTYGSYMKKKTELVNTTYIVAILDVLFAFLFSVGIFAILGYMATSMGTTIEEIPYSLAGAGLVFITLPVALYYMGTFGYVVGVGFFLMLAVTGWTSFLSLMEAFVAPFIEKFGVTRKKMYQIMCIVGFVCSLVYATGAGQIVLGMVDYTVNTFGLPLVGLLQALVAGWFIKGAMPMFRDHINQNSMRFFKAGMFWTACVKFVIPIFLIVTVIRVLWMIIVDGFVPPALGIGGEWRTAPELIVYVGGSIATTAAVAILFPRIKWKTPVDKIEG